MANALLEIPTFSDVPAYEFAIQLEQVTYWLSFAWSDRQGFWTMDVKDALKNPVVMGIRLFTGVDILGQYVSSELPPGAFFCFDTANEGKDPGRDDFGSRVILMYVESK